MPSDPLFLTVSEVSKILRVSKPTVYGAIKRGEIPGVVKIGKVVRIDWDTVYGAIKRGEIPGVVKIGKDVRINREQVIKWIGEGEGNKRKDRLPGCQSGDMVKNGKSM